MYVPDKYTIVASNMADVPARALSVVKPQVITTLGGTVSNMFPEFAGSFPKTVACMEAHWSRPKLALMDRRSWLAFIFLEQEGLNLFFDEPHPIYGNESYFDISMMPPEWVGLYRSMSSFTITGESVYSPFVWSNTLLPRSIDINQFAVERKINKTEFKDFERKLDIRQEHKLRCWMFTDAHDSLWIDEQHCNKKVYHVRADAFADAYVLPNPGEVLDQYLANIVAGGAPEDFDFRAIS
ncbi:hypothetical protein M5C99_10505 [Acidovorax sp. NCPPB 2350]|nr:hypothetical protein M5C99_10505 [Acidovorax sp. NCPPB 2350]